MALQPRSFAKPREWRDESDRAVWLDHPTRQQKCRPALLGSDAVQLNFDGYVLAELVQLTKLELASGVLGDWERFGKRLLESD